MLTLWYPVQLMKCFTKFLVGRICNLVGILIEYVNGVFPFNCISRWLLICWHVCQEAKLSEVKLLFKTILFVDITLTSQWQGTRNHCKVDGGFKVRFLNENCHKIPKGIISDGVVQWGNWYTSATMESETPGNHAEPGKAILSFTLEFEFPCQQLFIEVRIHWGGGILKEWQFARRHKTASQFECIKFV